MGYFEGELRLPEGHYDERDLVVISNHIKEIGKLEYDLLEVGCYLGRSTTIFGRAAKENKKTLNVVDPFYGGEEPPFREVVSWQFHRNMHIQGLLENIRVFPMTSESFFERIHECVPDISVLHLDGNHTQENIMLEIRWLVTKTHNMVVMHDTMLEEVNNCCYKIIENGFQEVYRSELDDRGMTIFMK